MNISKFNNFDISEAKGFPGLSKNFRKQGDYRVSFNIGDEEMDFSGTTYGDVYSEIINWLNEKGYNFTGPVHKAKVRKIFTSSEIEQEKSYNFNDFYEFDDDKFIMLRKINVGQIKSNILLILRNFGIDNSDIKFYGFDESSKSIDDVDDLTPVEKNEKKMTFIEAAQLILKQNDNTPMSANEIWDIIDDRDLVETSGVTPWASLLTIMLKSSDNGNVAKKYKTKLFHVVSDNPAMFILINPENEVQPVEGTEKLDDGNDIIKFGSYISSTGGSPNYTSTPSRPVTTGDKYDFTLSSDIENKPSEVKESPTGHIINPFRQAVCILGESGAGKSTTIYNILKEEKHDSQFIIPSASTTGLLSQFSPRENGYIQSRLGKMIEDAWKNPDKLYTAVFDECHKTNTIEMINDELLQAISIARNDENRFISLDEDTSKLYKNSEKDESGNIKIPDNFGFIFISSKPEIFKNNRDFCNRVDLIEITETKRPDTIKKLDYLRKITKSEKKGLLDLLDAKQNQ